MTPRLDAELAARGLARSRTHAARLISAGSVTVDGRGVVKPSAAVDAASVIEVAADDHYVSRGAHKLSAALDAFAVDVAGKVALDLGASTGGFTQVLRERGATPVVAVDVGHGQLAPTVASDPEVISVEGFNVRYMDADTLRSASGVSSQPQIVVGDLSFISLGHVLPAICRVAAADADIILLAKPQFEVGRTSIREGVVTDAALRSEAVMGVLWSAWDAGLGTLGVISSPIVGTHGNLEYLVHLAASRGSNPTEWISTVNQLTGAR
ncbi:TlyA family RNA methyltransferase [Microbacterium schleiferi]|uniref:TlyA family RNA methyltransferase n=1 Tax=Microbacterium schleiferi TaxID=69362 RepID=UPI00311D3A31